ncbi:GNAT family N-acetyltransferase [Roseicella aquatilis]|uniref:GNAT family N-acetyltransferase n=1 Tax=Roseicella aquatilis TaxID=2527868 RepID=A0A4R4D8J2_9PROT|nr:GNAT family N-acetyltransferase [Roseicella aquatilis]TCZ56740.1 GNAT family N-acetyltransferase [Roseicella aquatilis]
MEGELPPGLRLVPLPDPPLEFRTELARHIHAFHAETVPPWQSTRFALRLEDAAGALAGGFCGSMAWDWLFVEALWVAAAQRGTGAGRALLAAAERQAVAAGCHSAWLDTFQARGFYEALGYAVFGQLGDYPAGQTRWFLRKRLIPPG